MRGPLVMRSGGRSKNERMLVLVLRATGIAMLAGLVFCVCPFGWMDAIHRWMGLGGLPDIPIIRYLARSLSGMYAYLGGLLLYLSGDVRRHRGTILFLSITGLFFSIGMIFLDWSAGMPAFWTIGEGPMTILLCGILLLLLRRLT